jgi:hypothetical protein
MSVRPRRGVNDTYRSGPSRGARDRQRAEPFPAAPLPTGKMPRLDGLTSSIAKFGGYPRTLFLVLSTGPGLLSGTPIGEPLAQASMCSQGLSRPFRQAGSQTGVAASRA